MDEAQVIVIGGGVAGMAAFQRLRYQGCDAVLIEARSRLGGRVHTLHPRGWGAAVELGAEFIHGAPPELMAWADAETAARQNWTWDGHSLQPADESGGADRVFARMASIRPPTPDCSFAAFVDQCADLPAPARARALAFIEGFEAADPERISVYSLNQEFAASDDEQQHRPRGGYGPWLASLESPPPDGRVARSTVVERVVWRPGSVLVEARGPDGAPLRWRAHRAIVTLPLSILQRGAVAFDPPLDAKQAALAGLAMGGARRVTLRLREPFWASQRDAQGHSLESLGFLFGQAPATGHFPVWWVTPGAPQITGWAAGRHAWALQACSPQALRGRALSDLGRMLAVAPTEIEGLLLDCHSHDWESDPFALGAYSYAVVGGANAHRELARPLDDTLFFAGEATDADGHHATVQGALRSGLRAADECHRNNPRSREKV